MDFLGAMFQGIGETFKAGSTVHKAQIESRANDQNLKLKRDELSTQFEIAQFDFLNQSAENQFKQQSLIVAAVVVFIVVAMIFKK